MSKHLDVSSADVCWADEATATRASRSEMMERELRFILAESRFDFDF